MGSANPLLSGPTAVITTCIRPPFVASSDKAGYSSSSRFAAPHARRFSEGAQFSVRTLQKGAHLRRNRRGFPRCALSKSGAHLRRECAPSNQGTALDPVPLTRKVAQQRAAASFAVFGRVACPTALRGHVFEGQTDSHAHAKPMGMAHRTGLTASSATFPRSDSLSFLFLHLFGQQAGKRIRS